MPLECWNHFDMANLLQSRMGGNTRDRTFNGLDLSYVADVRRTPDENKRESQRVVLWRIRIRRDDFALVHRSSVRVCRPTFNDDHDFDRCADRTGDFCRCDVFDLEDTKTPGIVFQKFSCTRLEGEFRVRRTGSYIVEKVDR